MESYTDFAYLYDTFMEDVPYDKWADLLSSLFKAYGNNIHSVCDMGCGTGTLTRMMSERGFDMIGVDLSQDMLAVALDKQYSLDDIDDDIEERGLLDSEYKNDILYICQDMSELSLLEPVDAVYSVCDSINYLITDEDMSSCFKNVYNNLNKDGLFIFDFNTVYKYETVIGDTTIAENRENESFIWENYYSSEDHINEYDVTFFVRDEYNGDEDMFRRFTETHLQRGYELSEMKIFAKKAGFKYVTSLDEATHKEPTKESERIYLILRK